MSEQHFSTPQPVKLDVKLAGGDLDVATAEGDQSTVVLDGSPRLVENVRVQLVGSRLLIHQRRRSLIGMFGQSEGELSVRVSVPHGSHATVLTAAADSRLEGTFASLEVKSASGDVQVTGRIEGDALVETVSGTVRLPHIGGALRAKSVSGDVAVEAVEGTMSVKSVSGDIGVGSAREGTATLQSVSGEVDLGVAAGTSIDLDAASASGELSSEIPLSDLPGEHGGPRLVIRGRTVSGDFRVFRAA
jgi:DUF4097 and DUF4098 domain-containing protein YvlB